MQIKYVGPKTLVSTRGISFDKRKKDKFIYLDCVLQLIKAIDHDYEDTETYLYTAEGQSLVGEEILYQAKQYCPDIDTIMFDAQEGAKIYVDEKLMHTENSIFLNDADIYTLTKNLSIMRDYTVQRHVNKSVYYHVVKTFIERFRHHKIEYLSAPAHETYFHVFHTVKRGLLQQKNAVQSELSYHTENGQLFIKLSVLNA